MKEEIESIKIDPNELAITNSYILEILSKIQQEVGCRGFKMEKYIIDNYGSRLISNCYRMINLFSENSNELSFTESEAELAFNFHTFLRKGTDGEEATILWNWISKDYAKQSYCKFIKKLNSIIGSNYKTVLTKDLILNCLKEDRYEHFPSSDFEFRYVAKNMFSKEEEIYALNEYFKDVNE